MSAPTDQSTRPSLAADGTLRPEVSLRVPAAPAYVSVLRSTVALLASRLDFTIDEIEDLRIAVSEAASLILEVAPEGSDLVTEVGVGDDSLNLSITCTEETAALDTDGSWAWMALSALVDDVTASSTGSASVSMVKARGERL